LYLACQGTPNENTPLAWAHSLYLILDDTVNQQLSQDPRVEFDYATSVSSVGCAVDP
jgi:phosphorylase kinase alpha/beta subunit